MKLLKKIIPFILSFLIILLSFPFSASAATVSNFNFDVFDVITSSNSYSGTITNSSSYPGYKSCYISSVSGILKSFTIESFDYEDGYNFKLQKGDSISLEFYCYPNSRYISFTPRVVFYCKDSENHVFRYASKGTYERSSGKISFNLESDYDLSETYLQYIEFTDISLDSSHNNFSFYYKNVSATSSTAQSGFMDSVKSSFSKLWDWLKNIIDAIKDIPSKIGESLSSLGDSIGDFFTNLINSISEWFSGLIDDLSSFFSDVGNWFTELANKIKGFFTNLANSISGFFEKLWNRIWWGNENGESDYQKPVIDNKLNDILATLGDYQTRLKDTIDTVGNAADEVSNYISTGTQLVNGFINVAGGGITALIVFGMVFILVRKVVGR